MQTSNFYQNTAAQAGYITTPLNLVPPTVTLPDGSAYTLQGPSQGGVAFTPSNPMQAYGGTSQGNDAIRNMKDQVANYQYAPDYADAQKANAENSFGNGNPILQRGSTLTYDGQGQPVKIPLAIAQQMAYTDAVNNGRANSHEDYLGGQAPDARYGYSSNAVRNDYISKLNDNPMFQGSGAINPYLEQKKQAHNLSNQLYKMDNNGSWHDLSQDPNSDLNYASENLNSQGQGTKGMSQADQIKAQIAQLPQQNMNYRQAMDQDSAQRQSIANMMKGLAAQKPTWSNVPIVEKVIKS